jgi:uncharacterized protein
MNFAIPFSLTPTGQVRTVTDPNQIASDRVESLIGTFPGERVMLPDYGVNLPAFVFAPDAAGQSDIISLNVQQAMTQWEPSITLGTVTPNASQSDVGIVSIDIQFSLSSNPVLTVPQVATIEIGGNVVNG